MPAATVHEHRPRLRDLGHAARTLARAREDRRRRGLRGPRARRDQDHLRKIRVIRRPRCGRGPRACDTYSARSASANVICGSTPRPCAAMPDTERRDVAGRDPLSSRRCAIPCESPSCVVQPHEELVTAVTGDAVVIAQAVPQMRAQLLEQPVTTEVPAGVVHLLEVVDVDQQQTSRRAADRRRVRRRGGGSRRRSARRAASARRALRGGEAVRADRRTRSTAAARSGRSPDRCDTPNAIDDRDHARRPDERDGERVTVAARCGSPVCEPRSRRREELLGEPTRRRPRPIRAPGASTRSACSTARADVRGDRGALGEIQHLAQVGRRRHEHAQIVGVAAAARHGPARSSPR